jgi:hypothetical protein
MKTKAPNHFFSLRVFVGLLIVLTEIVFLNILAAAGVEVVLSSIVVTVALLIQLRFAVRADADTPADIAVFVFNWLFLDLAPKIQLIGAPQQLVNTSSVNVGKSSVRALHDYLYARLRLFEQAIEGRGCAEGSAGRNDRTVRRSCANRRATAIYGSRRGGRDRRLRPDGGRGGAVRVQIRQRSGYISSHIDSEQVSAFCAFGNTLDSAQ